MDHDDFSLNNLPMLTVLCQGKPLQGTLFFRSVDSLRDKSFNYSSWKVLSYPDPKYSLVVLNTDFFCSDLPTNSLGFETSYPTALLVDILSKAWEDGRMDGWVKGRVLKKYDGLFDRSDGKPVKREPHRVVRSARIEIPRLAKYLESNHSYGYRLNLDLPE